MIFNDRHATTYIALSCCPLCNVSEGRFMLSAAKKDSPGSIDSSDIQTVHKFTRVTPCAKCFFQLRQLRRIRRSLDDNAVATLVHAFVASRVDYCGSLRITDSSTFHALHCRRAVFEPSRMLVHLCGTLCPFISRTAT